jgi:hypothetical protein
MAVLGTSLEGSIGGFSRRSAWAPGITARVMQPGETPDSVLGHILKRLGLLVRFASEQTITLNTAAAVGGNASLMAADEREYCG